MRISKKILAIALSILMAVSMMPFTVFAADSSVSTASELTDAIANASEGDTITLLANISGSFTVPAGKNITINLNGHSISNDSWEEYDDAIVNYGTLTINGNGSVTKEWGDLQDNAVDGSGVGAAIENHGTTNINGGTYSAMVACVSGTVNFNSGSINGWYMSVACIGGTFNLNGGSVANNAAVHGGTLNVNGATFTGGSGSSTPLLMTTNDAEVNVESGTVNATIVGADSANINVSGGTVQNVNASGTSQVSISDGTVNNVYSNNDSTTTISGGNIGNLTKNSEDSTVTVTGGTFDESIDVTPYIDNSVMDVTDNNNGTITVNVNSNYVAKVGSTYYEDFEAAVTAARTGSVKTVTVVNNVNLTQYPAWDAAGSMHYIDITGVTVDLNGNEMTIGSRWSTLFSGTNGKIMNGTCTGTDCANWPNYNYGLYIWGPGSGNCANSGEQHATIELENLTCNYGIHCWNADVTIKNCTSTGSDSYYAVWADENTHVTIESGTYTTNGAAVLGTAHSTTDPDGELYVEGGNFTVPTGKKLISDGTDSNTENVKFSGGTADVPISQTNCANGFVPKDNGNGTYGVKTAAPEGANLTLEHSIKINVYANVDDYLPENFEEGLVLVEFTTPVASSQTAAPTTTDYDYDELQKADSSAGDFAGDCIFSYEAAPAQIAEEVTVTVKYDNEVVHTYSTSIMKYCETAIANSSDDNLVALAKAIYDYGKAANGVFSYTSASKFNLNENNYFNTTNVYDAVSEAASYYCDDDYDIEGYTYIATAVPTLRIYVNAQKAYAGYKAVIDDNVVSPKIELGLDGNPTGRICVDITGVLAEDMDYAHTVTFGSAYLTINMLNYVLAIYTGTTEDYARSIYNYHVAAEAYFGEGLV